MKSAERTSNEQVDSGGSLSPTSLKASSKLQEPPKQDYIHVRARRGQATDSHSLAERVLQPFILKPELNKSRVVTCTRSHYFDKCCLFISSNLTSG